MHLRSGTPQGGSEGRNEDYRRLSKIIRFFLARNLPNLRQESSSLVSTSLTHSGDDEDSEDSGIILLFFVVAGIFRNLPAESTSEMLASFTGWRPPPSRQNAIKKIPTELKKTKNRMLFWVALWLSTHLPIKSSLARVSSGRFLNSARKGRRNRCLQLFFLVVCIYFRVLCHFAFIGEHAAQSHL